MYSVKLIRIILTCNANAFDIGYLLTYLFAVTFDFDLLFVTISCNILCSL